MMHIISLQDTHIFYSRYVICHFMFMKNKVENLLFHDVPFQGELEDRGILRRCEPQKSWLL